MEVKDAKGRVITFSRGNYQITQIRELKVFREISKGNQRKLNEWDY